MEILIDLHVHSAATLCARGDIVSWTSEARKKGLQGIAVTDTETVRFREEADDILIIPGIEYRTEYGRVLGLFIEEQPVIPEYQRKGDRSWVFGKTIKAIKQAGGITVMAQPFTADTTEQAIRGGKKSSRFRQDFPDVWADHIRGDELISYFDAWEAYNSRYEYADNNSDGTVPLRQTLQNSDLIKIAGSDAYYPEEIGSSVVGVQVPDDFWQQTYAERLAIVRKALLSRMTVCKGGPVHEWFVCRREYDLQKANSRFSINPRLWFKCRKAARKYRRI